MDCRDIHVGDMVQIRSWEDMASEFGEGGRYGIRFIRTTPIPFIWSMKDLCGQVFTVTEVQYNLGLETCRIYFEKQGSHGIITNDMVKPYEDTTSYDPISTEELEKFLNS